MLFEAVLFSKVLCLRSPSLVASSLGKLLAFPVVVGVVVEADDEAIVLEAPSLDALHAAAGAVAKAAPGFCC